MKKPNKIKIGPQTFTIEFRSLEKDGMLSDGCHGYTLDQGNLIVVASSISPSKQKVTLMHEILHASRMVFENNRPDKKSDFDEWEHYFIAIYENTLLMCMKDNPDVFDWLVTDGE